MIAALLVALALTAPKDDLRRAVAAKIEAEAGPGTEAIVSDLRLGDPSLARASSFEIDLASPVASGRVKGKLIARGRETWLSADVELRGPVVVAARAIGRGQTVGEADVRVETRRLGDAATDLSVVVGGVARWDLPAGKPIGAGAVDRPLLVRRGDRVTARVTEPTFRVSAVGEALDSGKLGARVSVRIVDGRVVDGRVSGPGEVEVAR